VTPWLWLLTMSLAFSVALVGTSLPWVRRVELRNRVDPYVGTPLGVGRPAQARASGDSWSAIALMTRPVVADAVRLLDRTLGGSVSVRQRLARMGSDLTVERFRVEQLGWGLAGVAFTALIGSRQVAGGDWTDVPALLMLVGLGAVSGVLLRDRWLTRSVASRMQRLSVEFPTVVELLALSVGAGEGLHAALERVSRVGNGVFVGELTRVLNEIRSGVGTVEALQRLSIRIDTQEMRRFVDAVVVATERGTPLIGVLNAQVADAREASRRALIESGGRKEIAMMVPVVFLVLPLSVLFALFPGFYGFSMGSG